MAQATGSAGRIAIVEEAVFGVTPTNPTLQKLNITYGESLMAESDELIDDTINAYRGTTDSRNGLVKVTGSIPFNIGVDGMALLIKLLTGDVTTTQNAVNPLLYDHVFKRGNALTSFTLEKRFTDIGQSFIYTGLKVDSLKLQMEPGTLAKASVDVKGRAYSTSDTPLSTNITEYVQFSYANFEGGVLEGVDSPKLLNLSLELKNNVYTNDVVGSKFIDSIGAGQGEITGDITVQFKDLVYFNKWANESEESLTMTYTTSVGANAGKQFKIHLPRIKFNGSASPAIADKEGVKLTLKFRAFIDLNSASPTYGTDFVITVTDSQATV